VPSGGNLQTAINQAKRGDIILLARNGVYRGNFTLPAKSGSGWLVITTETNLPSQGTRMTPGLSSSLGLARIEGTTTSQPTIQTDLGASYYRLMGIEVTVAGNGDNQGIVRLGSGQQTMSNISTNITIDRAYIHGHANLQSKRCLEFNVAHAAVVDSYLSECHKKGQDAQAVLAWNTPGPFKIVNNYMAGSGENVMFGGADPRIPNVIPSDIEFRRNHVHKPESWFGTNLGTVKNLLELKDARRMLIEGNIFENNWRDGQTGWAILIKSNNQAGGQPWGVSEHITIRNNLIRNVVNGIAITRTNSNGRPSGSTNNVLIENNVMDQLGPQSSFGGWGSAFQLLNGPLSLVIRNNTVLSQQHIIMLDGGAFTDQLVFADNVATNGLYGIFGSGAGQGTKALDQYVPNHSIQGNVLVGADAGKYPSGNHYPSSLNNVGFAGHSGGNYQLNSSSQFKGAGTNGSDPGVNWSTFSQAIAGVR